MQSFVIHQNSTPPQQTPSINNINTPHNMRGFTLIELLVTCSILLILIGYGLPALNQFIQSSSTRTSINTIHSAIATARTQAVVHKTTVTLCPSADGISCQAKWQQHIIVFSDPNKNKQIDAGEALYQIFDLNTRVKISSRLSAGRSYLRFKPDGIISGTAGTLTVCPSDNNNRHARQLIVSFTGRTKHAADTDGDGIIETRKGKDVQCTS
ncbi:GspH/FimT family pseudopilin [Zooshikella marina]|uniref:GspH/FimT family pseudopilin n=1 Tax=Zooshikella ganghwensis TaxID=202772 RepID=UPI001BAF79F5|nr:GspH/FimT family pseudopilin [Zooshikella ganghwensis]MBU2707370.1 GspH/FimT family pseudopilin [Zooshikella ganghwensis]